MNCQTGVLSCIDIKIVVRLYYKEVAVMKEATLQVRMDAELKEQEDIIDYDFKL